MNLSFEFRLRIRKSCLCNQWKESVQLHALTEKLDLLWQFSWYWQALKQLVALFLCSIYALLCRSFILAYTTHSPLVFWSGHLCWIKQNESIRTSRAQESSIRNLNVEAGLRRLPKVHNIPKASVWREKQMQARLYRAKKYEHVVRNSNWPQQCWCQEQALSRR